MYHWDEFHRAHGDLTSFAREAETRWMVLPVVAEDGESARHLLQHQKEMMEEIQKQIPLLEKIQAEVGVGWGGR